MSAIKSIYQKRIKGQTLGGVLKWFSNRMRQQIHSRCTAKPIRNLAIKISQSSIGKMKMPCHTSNLISLDNLQKHLDSLNKHGYTFLDKQINNELIEKIQKYSETLTCFDPYQKNIGEFKPSDASPKTHIGHFRREHLVDFKEIMDLANDEGILNLMQDFLGAKPTISNVCMWWSFGGREGAQEAQNFHRDNDDIKFCKLFFYLTDVSEENGPHIYVKDSSASSKYRKVRRYADKEIEDTFGKENILSFSYPKGTAFLADTYGFHKGLPPKQDNRLLLQIEYSLYPIGYQDYNPIHVSYDHQYNKYSNRLLIK